MTVADLPDVVALADAAHPHHPESPAIFAERLALAPAGCLVLGDGVEGYVIAHPWTGRGPPVLDAAVGALPAPPGAWHLHDVVLAPARRGEGWVAPAVAQVLALAGVLPVTLVAVDGLAPYWARHGFRALPCADPAFASYGAGATWMRRDPR